LDKAKPVTPVTLSDRHLSHLTFLILASLALHTIMSTVSKENGKGKGKGTENDPNDRAAALLDLSISLIDQALDILTRHLKEDRQMTHPSKLMPGGSVGKHFRHVSVLCQSCNED
jgi:hypothetical protein